MDCENLTWAREIVATIGKIKLFDCDAISDLYYDIQDLVTNADQCDLDAIENVRAALERMANKRAALSDRLETYREVRQRNLQFLRDKGQKLEVNVGGILHSLIGLAKKMYERLASETSCSTCGDSNIVSWGARRKSFLDRLNCDFGPFLLLGPTGSGKSFFARDIWKRYSELAKRELPWQECNCAQTKDPESVIFGTLKNLSYNGSPDSEGLLEKANCGVLFLDEISRMSIENQNKLLQALNLDRDGYHHFKWMGGTEDVKSKFVLIAATSEPIDKWVEERSQRFVKDLYYRIGGETPFVFPPIEEQGDVIGDVFESLLDFYSKHNPLGVDGVATNINTQPGRVSYLNYIKQKRWPGGVRSLDPFAKELIIAARTNANTIDQRVVDQAIRSFENSHGCASFDKEGITIASDIDHSVSGKIGCNELSADKAKRILEVLNISAPKNDNKCVRVLGLLAVAIIRDPKGTQKTIAMSVRKLIDGGSPVESVQWSNERLKKCTVNSNGKLCWSNFRDLVRNKEQAIRDAMG